MKGKKNLEKKLSAQERLIDHFLKTNPRRAAELLELSGRRDDAAKIFSTLGDYYYSINRYEEAKECFIKAARNYENCDSPEQAQKARDMAVSCGLQKLKEENILALREGNERISKSNLESGKIQADAYLFQGKQQAEAIMKSSDRIASSNLQGAKVQAEAVKASGNKMASAYYDGSKIQAKAIKESGRDQADAICNVAEATRHVAKATEVAGKMQSLAALKSGSIQAKATITGAKITSKSMSQAARINANAVQRAADRNADAMVSSAKITAESTLRGFKLQSDAVLTQSKSIRESAEISAESRRDAARTQADSMNNMAEATEKAGHEQATATLKGSKKLVQAIRGGGAAGGIMKGLFHGATGDIFRPGLKQAIEERNKKK